MITKNQVQLITYPDSLGGDLKTLNQVLLSYFPNIFQGGVHILPPFPSSGDRGFAPITYFEIESNFGSWDDIQNIGKNFDVMLDLMVNHISKKSDFFQDFITHGKTSQYSDLFITLDKIWKNGIPTKEDIDKIFLRRTVPYSSFTIEETGGEEKVWTTFGSESPSEQIDIDINSELGKKLIIDFLSNFSKQNVKMVRLDAIGFVIKKLGTSCFFVEPEIYNFLDWIKNVADSLGLELLPEVHAEYPIQFKLAEHGFWIYDFILPYMILDTIINESNIHLKEYLKIRPTKQFTMLDCHDGIPVKPDINGLVEVDSMKKLTDICESRGSTFSRIFSAQHRDMNGFDIHQIRGTYYSILNCDDNAYLAARAIQFFVPGIPQVYYVGLLAGENDEARVKRTGEGREINRHNFTVEEIEQEMQKGVVQRLLKLIRFRNEYPAFNGDFEILDSYKEQIKLSWKLDDKVCTLNVNLQTNINEIEYIDNTGQLTVYRI